MTDRTGPTIYLGLVQNNCRVRTFGLKPDHKFIMELIIALGFALAIFSPAVSAVAVVSDSDVSDVSPVPAAGSYTCETGTNHHSGTSCHGSIGDYACSPTGYVVRHMLRSKEILVFIAPVFLLSTSKDIFVLSGLTKLVRSKQVIGFRPIILLLRSEQVISKKLLMESRGLNSSTKPPQSPIAKQQCFPLTVIRERTQISHPPFSLHFVLGPF